MKATKFWESKMEVIRTCPLRKRQNFTLCREVHRPDALAAKPRAAPAEDWAFAASAVEIATDGEAAEKRNPSWLLMAAVHTGVNSTSAKNPN